MEYAQKLLSTPHDLSALDVDQHRGMNTINLYLAFMVPVFTGMKTAQPILDQQGPEKLAADLKEKADALEKVLFSHERTFVAYGWAESSTPRGLQVYDQLLLGKEHVEQPATGKDDTAEHERPSTGSS